MKIYLLILNSAYEGDIESYYDAYENYEKAREEYLNQIEFIKSEFNNEIDRNLEIITEEGENYFEMYEEGYYSQNHMSINIIELEVLK